MRSKKFPITSLLLLGSVTILSGCSFAGGPFKADTPEQSAWLQSGTLSIGGPLISAGSTQLVLNTDQDYLSQSYGFSVSGPRSLVIEPKKNKATLFMAGKAISSADILEGAMNHLQAGSYTIAHKQRNPLWYAPDEYFSSRGLPIPGEGDKMRFLRGAYGDFALFIDADTAIHSGPFALDEIAGVRCDEKEMSKIFYSMEIGDSVQVVFK
jgi:hypothetical protein